MVGNNETYRAMLDEGFTQFLTKDGGTTQEDVESSAASNAA